MNSERIKFRDMDAKLMSLTKMKVELEQQLQIMQTNFGSERLRFRDIEADLNRKLASY
jgi:hypothetical protein